MTHERTPSLLTTHEYISTALKLLGETKDVHEEHNMKSVPLDPTPSLDVTHTLEAQLIIPRRWNDETGRTSRYGKRLLTIGLWGEEMATDEHRARSQTMTYSTRSRGIGETTVPCLAEMTFAYDTKRLDTVHTQLFNDGYLAGIDDEDEAREAILDRFGFTIDTRGRSHRYLERAVRGMSLLTGGSVQKTRDYVDFHTIARDVERETGQPIPQSLRRGLPGVDVRSVSNILTEPNQPHIDVSEMTIDHMSRDFRVRTITEYVMTTYTNFQPPEEQQDAHMAYFRATPRYGRDSFDFAIDVVQEKLGRDGREIIEPTDEAEIRAMVQPFINTVANLRRYARSANY